ncbi:hypothetical protein ACYT6K_10460, partial [Streptococcus pyogenes]
EALGKRLPERIACLTGKTIVIQHAHESMRSRHRHFKLRCMGFNPTLVSAREAIGFEFNQHRRHLTKDLIEGL